MIHTLKSQGLSVSEIARPLKVDRKTVRKYLRFNADDPSAMQRKPRTRKLAVYEPYLLERVHCRQGKGESTKGGDAPRRLPR